MRLSDLPRSALRYNQCKGGMQMQSSTVPTVLAFHIGSPSFFGQCCHVCKPICLPLPGSPRCSSSPGLLQVRGFMLAASHLLFWRLRVDRRSIHAGAVPLAVGLDNCKPTKKCSA
eukprot:4535592-Amphidinium_carterae.1